MQHRKIYKKPKNKKYTSTYKSTKTKHRKVYKKTHKNIHNLKLVSSNPIEKDANNNVNNNTNTNANTKTKSTMCAPFIEPTNISKTKKLTQSNINIIESATDESCFTIESLRKIASKWNTSHPDMMIIFDNTTSGKTLWNEINKMMSNKCKTEICWMKQDFIKDSPLSRELLKNFKPLMPKKWDSNPIEWLNTIDIRDVMNQYEIKYPDFEFVGPVPMDFDTKLGFGQCVVDELCKVKLNNLMAKGDSKLGVIFNLDKHTQSGSHWVAMYCDINNTNGGFIGYWDSYGMKPSPEVVVLMDRLKSQGKDLGHNLEIKINKTRHQYKNSECGVYCIYFITSLLDGKNFEEVVENIISDDNMNAKRKQYYNKDI
jgi:hypothetical protein